MLLGGRFVRRSAVAALLLTAVPVWIGGAGESASAGDPTRCERFAAESAERAELVTGTGDDVLVVGDSWSAGLGLSSMRDSWPTRLPGRVRVAAFSGSGFSREASECGDVSFASRAASALAPGIDLVVVEGGLNDHDRSDAEIRAGFSRLVNVLGERQVVVVGPAAAPSRADAVRRVDALLARLAASAGWEYVAAYDWELGYLPDGLHLTAEGHREFGDKVAAALH